MLDSRIVMPESIATCTKQDKALQGLACLAGSSVGYFLLLFLVGIHFNFMPLLFASPLFLICFVYGVIRCINNTINRARLEKPFAKFSLVWLLFAAFPFVFPVLPGYCGAWLTLQYAGQTDVIKQGLSLISDNLTYFEEEKLRKPNNPPVKWSKGDDVPRAIKRLNPQCVWVSEDHVAIKKYGLGGFSGFVITKSPDRKPADRTWQHKIADHLYWINQ
jgi:hypothetical protein